ncbi:E3 ubiquitin-protein ligase RING1-like [Impatiens glandulifera]|uniref:E3 ubiquitin-protein ligase RING1-like n=1 Tax=Impatiens glandulifera TaxID=253017 RepID=UPI001FB0C202|nr:E3 ubiquitin-protein ligase RING1-like [Impatiens glandulifera]
MAATISDLIINIPAANALVYDFFDLDLAITMALESPNGQWIKQFQSPTATSAEETTLLVSQMPTLSADQLTATNSLCTVCLEGFEIADAKRFNCGHVYHADCITEWLLLHDSCPLCRCDISGGHLKNN